MNQSLLQVDELRVDIPVRGQLRTVIHDATFDIAAGEAVGLVGESGSGKSMTARAIMRLLPPKSVTPGVGRVRWAVRSRHGPGRVAGLPLKPGRDDLPGPARSHQSRPVER